MSGRASRTTAAACVTVCLVIQSWAINSVTHEPWMGATFAAAGVLGLFCLLRRTT